ncbi:hypothetical protein DFJ74DRAFT_648784 [Hyaloraphidium curvatum]|nr:hypothetical protein DFJ74DRAFT_648784 [Hyaloraphidium curvatum]
MDGHSESATMPGTSGTLSFRRSSAPDDDALNGADTLSSAPPSAPASFTPREWLTLFPSRPPRPPSLGEYRPYDPAEHLRLSDPLNEEALLRGLRGSTPQRLICAFQLWLAPFSAKMLERYLLYLVPTIGVVVAMWVLNDGRFGTSQLIIGTINISVFLLALVIGPLFIGLRATVTRPEPGRAAAAGDLSRHPLGPAVRWVQLIEAGADVEMENAPSKEEKGELQAEGASKLVRHDHTDPLCPCILPSCAGALLKQSGHLRVMEYAIRFSLCFFTYAIALGYTSLVSFGPRFWTTWYFATFGVLSVATCALYFVVNLTARFSGNISLLRISMRLHHRAMSIALSSMLDRQRKALFGPEVDAAHGEQSEELYVKLHDSLTASWEERLPLLASGAVILVLTFFMVPINLILNIIAGMCVTGWFLGITCFAILILTIDVVNIAVSNSQITVITDLYLSARKELRTMALRSDPSRRVALQMARRHDLALESFLSVERFRGKLLGFAVDAMVARNVLITVFTLLVGLWSIFRISGIYVTMESICPTHM